MNSVFLIGNEAIMAFMGGVFGALKILYLGGW